MLCSVSETKVFSLPSRHGRHPSIRTREERFFRSCKLGVLFAVGAATCLSTCAFISRIEAGQAISAVTGIRLWLLSFLFLATQDRFEPAGLRSLCVQSIDFAPALPDRANVARMRHDHLASELGEQAAHPRRVRARLRRDAAARHWAEHFPHGLGRRAQPLFPSPSRPLHPGRSTSWNDPQIQPDSQPAVEQNSSSPSQPRANLLHCRSPFYLCFEQADNLGAYRMPSGDLPSTHL